MYQFLLYSKVIELYIYIYILFHILFHCGVLQDGKLILSLRPTSHP